MTLVVVTACSSGPRGDEVTSPIASPPSVEGCGGGLAILGDEHERAAELIVTARAASVERLASGVRIGLDGGRSFVLRLTEGLSPPIAVGDDLDVAIQCNPVARDHVACFGSVHGPGGLVALNTEQAGWNLERGPLLEHRPHRNYGATDTYAVVVAHAGASATTPLRGCAELVTPSGTFRVAGREIVHRDPRPAGASDFRSFGVIRVR